MRGLLYKSHLLNKSFAVRRPGLSVRRRTTTNLECTVQQTQAPLRWIHVAASRRRRALSSTRMNVFPPVMFRTSSFSANGGYRAASVSSATGTHFLANQLTANVDGQGNPLPPTITPIRQDTELFQRAAQCAGAVSVAEGHNLRFSYGRGISRPNIGDLVPSTTVDPNASPKSINKGNPEPATNQGKQLRCADRALLPAARYLAGRLLLQAAFRSHLPTTTQTTDPQYPGVIFQLNQSINGPSAHIQGIETQWEQRSLLPSRSAERDSVSPLITAT